MAHEGGGSRQIARLGLTRLFLPGPRALGGLNKIWAHNPKLEGVAGLFGTRCHAGHYFLSEREREIGVCIITSKWHSACPSNAHKRRGKGLPTHG